MVELDNLILIPHHQEHLTVRIPQFKEVEILKESKQQWLVKDQVAMHKEHKCLNHKEPHLPMW